MVTPHAPTITAFVNMLCENLVFDLKKEFRLPQLSRCKVSSTCRFSFCTLLVTDFGKCTDPWKFLLYALRDVLKRLSSKTARTGGEEEKQKRDAKKWQTYAVLLLNLILLKLFVTIATQS